MSKIIIDKQVLENWIKYIDTFPLYPEDRIKLKSILQQSEEYNENEAIELLKEVIDDYSGIRNDYGRSYDRYYIEINSDEEGTLIQKIKKFLKT